MQVAKGQAEFLFCSSCDNAGALALDLQVFSMNFDSTILAKMCGTKCHFPNCCSIRSLPPSPPMQCWTTRRQAFPYEQHCMGGGGGGGRIWPKERLFPCENLIDGRGSAFCKLVPHNFGQDCRLSVFLVTILSLH